MRTYKRIQIKGDYYTLNLARRKDNNLLIQNIEVLRTTFRKIKLYLATPFLGAFHYWVAKGIYSLHWGATSDVIDAWLE